MLSFLGSPSLLFPRESADFRSCRLHCKGEPTRWTCAQSTNAFPYIREPRLDVQMSGCSSHCQRFIQRLAKVAAYSTANDLRHRDKQLSSSVSLGWHLTKRLNETDYGRFASKRYGRTVLVDPSLISVNLSTNTMRIGEKEYPHASGRERQTFTLFGVHCDSSEANHFAEHQLLQCA